MHQKTFSIKNGMFSNAIHLLNYNVVKIFYNNLSPGIFWKWDHKMGCYRWFLDQNHFLIFFYSFCT